jgi:hypothetical protein
LGGSIDSITCWMNASAPGSGSRIKLPWRSDENSIGRREICFRSSYLVIAQ